MPSMKEPFVPPIECVTLESLLHALGDNIRLRILANLHKAEKPLICSEATAGIAKLSSSTASYHFRILREGGLIRSQREGKECYNWLRSKELETRFPGLLTAVLKQI